MKFAVVISTKDPAGINIKQQLLDNYHFIEIRGKLNNPKIYYLSSPEIFLFTVNKESINCEDFDKEISENLDENIDLIIFATKHDSKSGIPSLTVHAPGNWSKAEYGGEDNALCTAPARLIMITRQFLEKNNRLEGFEVIQECTHHGPFVEKPALFIEIGSRQEQWINKEAGKIIAKTIIDATNEYIKHDSTPEIAFGIGGLHHTPNFKKLTLNYNIAVDHVCPKYMLGDLTKNLVNQALNKTLEKVNYIILDWKGLGHYKEQIKDILGSLDEIFRKKDIKIKRTKDWD